MDNFDVMFERAERHHKERDLIIEIDPRTCVRRKKKKDPVLTINNLPIMDEIKKKAVAYFNKYIEPLDIVEKDVSACVFWAVYAASRILKVPVALDIIARLSGLGMDKYDAKVKFSPLEYGVKVEHKKVTSAIGYFTTIFNGTPAMFDTTPCDVYDFIDLYMLEQDIEEYKEYVHKFVGSLLEDEFWEDQNPSMLAYAILTYLSNIQGSPFYGRRIVFPIFVSNNIIADLINKLRSDVISLEEDEEEEDIMEADD